MSYASHTLNMLLYNAQILFETSHALSFQHFVLPEHSQAILVVCPHCVLRQNTNLLVIRRHQSRNQGLGTAWSIGHAQKIRSLGRSWVKQNRSYFQCMCILVQYEFHFDLFIHFNVCSAAFLYHQYSKLQDSLDRKW